MSSTKLHRFNTKTNINIEEITELSTKRATKKILQEFGVSEQYYSLDGYLESAVCMEKADSYWRVYNGERNNQYCTADYPIIWDACREFVRRLAPTIEDESIYIERLMAEVKQQLNSELSNRTQVVVNVKASVHEGFASVADGAAMEIALPGSKVAAHTSGGKKQRKVAIAGAKIAATAKSPTREDRKKWARKSSVKK